MQMFVNRSCTDCWNKVTQDAEWSRSPFNGLDPASLPGQVHFKASLLLVKHEAIISSKCTNFFDWFISFSCVCVCLQTRCRPHGCKCRRHSQTCRNSRKVPAPNVLFGNFSQHTTSHSSWPSAPFHDELGVWRKWKCIIVSLAVGAHGSRRHQDLCSCKESTDHAQTCVASAMEAVQGNVFTLYFVLCTKSHL